MPEQTLQSIAFPTLDEAQVREFERGMRAITKSYRDGQTLITVGDRDWSW
jgi:thiamine monophosphate kinase